MSCIPTEISASRLVDLVSRGLSNAELAVEFGCAVRTLDRWRRRNPKVNDQILRLRGLDPTTREVIPKDLTQPHRPRASCYHQHKCPQEACRAAYNAYQTGRRRAAAHPARYEIEVRIARGWDVDRIAAEFADRGVTADAVRKVWAAWDREVGVASLPLAG